MNNEKNPNLFFFRLCPGIGSSGKNRNAPTNAKAAKDSQKSAFPTSSLTELNRIREIGIKKSRGGKKTSLKTVRNRGYQLSRIENHVCNSVKKSGRGVSNQYH